MKISRLKGQGLLVYCDERLSLNCEDRYVTKEDVAREATKRNITQIGTRTCFACMQVLQRYNDD